MPQWRKLWVKATESLDINDMPDDFHRLLWLMMPLDLTTKRSGDILQSVLGRTISGAAFFIRQGSTISYCRQKAAFEFRNSVGEGCAGSPQNTGTRRRLFAFNGV
jgi:hypothetical protein